MDWLNSVETVFANPPAPFAPERSTLKAWAMYCLRDRGFKVVYAEKGDFAIELRSGEKIYFRVSQTAPTPEARVYWIIYSVETQTATIVPPNSDNP